VSEWKHLVHCLIGIIFTLNLISCYRSNLNIMQETDIRLVIQIQRLLNVYMSWLANDPICLIGSHVNAKCKHSKRRHFKIVMLKTWDSSQDILLSLMKESQKKEKKEERKSKRFGMTLGWVNGWNIQTSDLLF